MDIATQISELKRKLSDEKLKGQPDSNVVASLTEEITKLELTQIPFTVSARTARLIGQENFANAEGICVISSFVISSESEEITFLSGCCFSSSCESFCFSSEI